VILAVSIPEGLAISVNIALSLSMEKMLKDKNLVRKIDVRSLILSEKMII
jgi:magnesium-transporting ATPase (P-type)